MQSHSNFAFKQPHFSARTLYTLGDPHLARAHSDLAAARRTIETQAEALAHERKLPAILVAIMGDNFPGNGDLFPVLNKALALDNPERAHWVAEIVKIFEDRSNDSPEKQSSALRFLFNIDGIHKRLKSVAFSGNLTDNNWIA